MDGILPLLKPVGMTSHDCVDRLRKITGQRKIGHAGTLDPSAKGVLPVCLGKATKVVQYMAEDTKTYVAEVMLGAATETEDRDGKVISEKKVVHPPTVDEVQAALQKWRGPIEQIPPMYSAVKVGGKRLYEYAREGIEVERPIRHVTIFELDLLDPPETVVENRSSFRIRVRCSKGTYIRTLAVNIGETLGYPAHISSLVRTVSGSFTLNDCLTFEAIERLVREEQFEKTLLPFEKALSALPKWIVSDELAENIQHGAVLPLPEQMQAQRFTVYNGHGMLLAVYRRHPTKANLVKPDKVFVT